MRREKMDFKTKETSAMAGQENLTEMVADNAAGAAETVKEKVGRQKRLFSTIGLRFFFLSLIMMGVQLIVILTFQIFMPEIYLKYANIISLLPISIVGFPLGYLFTRNIEKAPVIEQKYEFGVKQFIPFIFIGFAVMVLGNVISTIINTLIASAAEMEATTDVEQLLSGVDMWQNLLMVVIFAPILEEFLLRK